MASRRLIGVPIVAIILAITICLIPVSALLAIVGAIVAVIVVLNYRAPEDPVSQIDPVPLAAQVATVALAAHFSELWWVVLGTTAGMMLANVPVVLIGHKAAERIPAEIVRWVTAAVFALLGLLAVRRNALARGGES